MNRQNIKQQLRRAFFAIATAGAVFTFPKTEAGNSSDKPYGPGALYQIEFVAGDNGASYAPVGQRGAAAALNGGGQWLWFALYPDGTADYAGSDCLDGLGSFADKGDATWAYSGGSIVISNVVLNGLKFLSNLLGCPNTCDPSQVYFCYTSTTITVPAVYGHYTGTVGAFEPPPKIIINCTELDAYDPNGGMSLVQVAPGSKPTH